MTYLYCFFLLIKQINLGSIYHLNIKFSNIKFSNIKFSIEKEEDGCLPFLDINIFHENNKFATKVFRKKDLHWGLYQLQKFYTWNILIGLNKSLLFRCFSLSSDFIKFYHKIDKSKGGLYKNGYACDLVDKRIKEFLDKILAPKLVVSTVPNKNLIIALPYLSKLSLQIRTRINRIMKNKLPYCNIQFVFQTKCRISCNATYYGKTKSHLVKSECVNTCEFLHSLGKELKVTMILPLKNVFYSAITHLILDISQFLQPTTTTLKSR